MKLFYTERFEQSSDEAPANVKRAFAQQAQFLAANLRHSSLKAKKYDVANDIWQARVNRDWRFHFQIQGDTCYLDIIPHAK
jgi:plasmid maintenance system killer protein